jgi:CBS domain-containing protein
MRVKDVMTTDVVTARPEMTLKDAAREMAARGISGMPVVDDEMRVIGVISEADLVAKERHQPYEARGVLGLLVHRGVSDGERRFEARNVAEAMTAPAVTVAAYCPLTGAAERMLEGGINRLPVMHRGELVGIVTRADLVRAFVRSNDELAATSGRRLSFIRSCGPTAGRSRSACTTARSRSRARSGGTRWLTRSRGWSGRSRASSVCAVRADLVRGGLARDG